MYLYFQVNEACQHKLLYLWSSRGSSQNEIVLAGHGLSLEPKRYLMLSVIYEKTEATYLDHHTSLDVTLDSPYKDEVKLNR